MWNDLAAADLRRLGEVTLRGLIVALDARDGCLRVQRADDEQRSFQFAGDLQALVRVCSCCLIVARFHRGGGEDPEEVGDEPKVADLAADREPFLAQRSSR